MSRFVRFLEWLTDRLMSRSKKPWVRFTMNGISSDGQLRIQSAYNKAFIKNATEHGLLGASDEETVQNFLLGTIIAPKEMFEDDQDPVTSDAHPFLQEESNKFRRG